MSGGALNYISLKVKDAAFEIKQRNISTLHNAFTEHLLKVAEALHDIEWVLSGDMSEGDDIKVIEAVISKEMHLQQIVKEAKVLKQELENILKDLK